MIRSAVPLIWRKSFVVASALILAAAVASGSSTNLATAAAPVASATAAAGSPAPRNFAVGAVTRQSSTPQPGVGDSAKAVDGNPNGKWYGGGLDQSVTETAREVGPWWEADLGGSRYLTELKISNRAKPPLGKEDRSVFLSNFWVFLSPTPFASDDPDIVAADPGVTAIYVNGPAESLRSISLQSLTRYVRVQIPRDAILTLAEVEALGPAGMENFAAFGTATASSTSYGGSPGRAIDGDAVGTHRAGSVSHTALENHAWWQVDLGVSRLVSEVRVWNRTDCCADRLSDFYVFASDEPFSSNDPGVLAKDPKVATAHITDQPKPMVSVPFDRPVRYVRVQLAGSNFLSLAEVEVIGPEPRNYAAGGTATQSSTSYGGIAEYAQDNNRSGRHVDRTVSHTDRESEPWWQVDLGTPRVLNEIRVWNRADCCADRLSDFYVFASDQPFASNDPAVLARDPGVTATHITTQPSPVVSIPVDRTARYVRVQLVGTNFLSLGEVEVLGPEVLQRPDPDAWIDQHNFGMFICYGMSTATDQQWVDPLPPPGTFNPGSKVDTDKWIEAAQSAGMDYALLTAKHHDGFALWPTRYSNYSIAASKYENGEGDIVRDYMKSVRAGGLKPGLYFSIWDKFNIESMPLIKNQLRELLVNYGDIDYLWLDGYGRRIKQGTVAWNDLRDFIHQVSPNTIVGVNNRQVNPALSDIQVQENSKKEWNPSGVTLPLDIAHPMDSNKTWFFNTEARKPKQTLAPLSAETINKNRKTMASLDVTYSLGIGPRLDGTIPEDYVRELRRVGELYPG